jgi:hypothetical protein
VGFFGVGTAVVGTGAVVAGAGCAVAGTVVSGGNASTADGTEVVPQPAATNMTNVEVTVTRRIPSLPPQLDMIFDATGRLLPRSWRCLHLPIKEDSRPFPPRRALIIGRCGEVLLLVWFLWDPRLPARSSLCGQPADPLVSWTLVIATTPFCGSIFNLGSLLHESCDVLINGNVRDSTQAADLDRPKLIGTD